MRKASANSIASSWERPSLAKSKTCTTVPHSSRKVTTSPFASDGTSAALAPAKRRLMRARSDRIEDCATIEIIKACRDLSFMQFDAAQIDRGGLDRAVTEQDLQYLERVDVRLDRGLCLETHEHRHGEGMAKPMQRAVKPRGAEGHGKCRRESGASYASAMAVEE